MDNDLGTTENIGEREKTTDMLCLFSCQLQNVPLCSVLIYSSTFFAGDFVCVEGGGNVAKLHH